MSLRMLQQIQNAISNLNPNEVRQRARRPVRLNLFASTTSAYEDMEAFFYGEPLTPASLVELKHILHRAGDVVPYSENAIDVYAEGTPHPRHAYVFRFSDPYRVVDEILDDHFDEAGLSLSRHLPPFRGGTVKRVIRKISKENAFFSLATALPDMIPLLSLPWAVGEFASDTAFLTMNQVRMAFLLSAAGNREVGYREQKGEIAGIVAGAFGWRAIARELAGKIPMGGGLIPKAAIAYAGTYVAGLGIERYHRLGRGLTDREKREAYEAALSRGKKVAGSLLNMRPAQG